MSENTELKKLTTDIFESEECPKEAKVVVVNKDGAVYFGGYIGAHPTNTSWIGIRPCECFAWKDSKIQMDSSSFPDGCIILRPIVQ